MLCKQFASCIKFAGTSWRAQENQKVLVWYDWGLASPVSYGQTSPTDWVPVNSLALCSGREVFWHSAEQCQRGSLLRDGELLGCLTWLVPHRVGSPGCPQVQDWGPEKQRSPLLQKGQASSEVRSSGMVAEVWVSPSLSLPLAGPWCSLLLKGEGDVLKMAP